MRAIKKCKKCGREFEIIKGYRYCKYVGCIEYNKKFGKKLFAQEEE